MRGIYTPVTDIRRKILMEITNFVREQRPAEQMDSLPFSIIEMGNPIYRCCSYRELSIVRQRIRLALGLPLVEEMGGHSALEDINSAFTDRKVISTPLVQVIRAACEKCPEDMVVVTDKCQSCMAHPCSIVCPRNAITFPEDKALIDQGKCVKCMKCVDVCPYAAVTRMQRPCAEACGVDAIDSDEDGYARILQDKCVNCGLCTVSCPFAAISDKSEIVQVLFTLKNKEKDVYAIIAPSFVGQFGRKVPPEAIFEGIRELGFSKVMEVAYGADCDTLLLAESMKNREEFLGTSCCPSWVMTARAYHPEFNTNIAESFTPMVETARKIKDKQAKAKVIFIGPCIAKKYEALTAEMAPFVDHVLTFEELAALFVAFGIDVGEIETSVKIDDASSLGRGYALAGGVGGAIIETARQNLNIDDVAFERAETLSDCRVMLKKIAKGEMHPDLVEGLACPGGCIGGPGTLGPLRMVKREVNEFSRSASYVLPQCEEHPE
jgi:[FeFe] hydrogenase (group B1/B3)